MVLNWAHAGNLSKSMLGLQHFLLAKHTLHFIFLLVLSKRICVYTGVYSTCLDTVHRHQQLLEGIKEPVL